MSEHTTTSVRPEIEAFVAQVRARLVDLSEDEREELLGGLEADLVEKVADGADLGDPWLYAAELRAAAGLPEARRPRIRAPRLRPPSDEEVAAFLDRLRDQWFAEVERHPVGPRVWEVVATLRPAWWVLRAWVAVTLVDIWAGPWERVSMVPSLAAPGLGIVLLLVTVVASTLIGLGRLWPGSGPDRSHRSRLALLALNGAALVALVSFSSAGGTYLSDSPTGETYYGGGGAYVPRDGLRLDGAPVRNVFAYDADGEPLTGVQLFRGNGDPLAVSAQQAADPRDGRSARTVGCGWFNGSTQLFNVFPLGDRVQGRGTCLDPDRDDSPVTAAVPPFAQVPPVTSPVPLDPTAPLPEPESAGPSPVRPSPVGEGKKG